MAIRCGTCTAPLDRHYCLECGTPLLIPCPECAFPVRWGTRFCHFCGLAFDSTRESCVSRPTIMNETKARERAASFPYYGYSCPLCGIRARMEDAFRCRGCGESFICKRHLKTEDFLCERCFEYALLGRPARAAEECRKPALPPDSNERPEGSPGLEGMIYVPAGEFLMGDDRKTKLVEAFYIDPYPVTNAQYQAFDSSHSFPAEKAECPVHVGLSWFHAKAYALWAGKRLPTEEEWEKAARGTDGRLFPWGNEYDIGRCNTVEGEILDATPVGKYPAGKSPYGCYDMAGNALEWTDDWYDEERNLKVVKGGSYYEQDFLARCAGRMGFDLLFRTGFIPGFRCAKSP